MSLNSNVLIPYGLSDADRAKLLGHSVSTNIKYYSYARKNYLDNARIILDEAFREQEMSEKEQNYILPFRQKESPQTASL